MKINKKFLDFATENLIFDQQVVKNKAAYSLPYDPKKVYEIFNNKNSVTDDVYIRPGKYKYKKVFLIKSMKKNLVKDETESKDFDIIDEIQLTKLPNSIEKFKPKVYFVKPKSSLSDSQIEANGLKKFSDTNFTKSFDNLSLINENGFFLTESVIDSEKFKVATNKYNNDSSVVQGGYLKKLNDINWDDYLIDSLSENTARWIVMKQVFDRKVTFINFVANF